MSAYALYTACLKIPINYKWLCGRKVPRNGQSEILMFWFEVTNALHIPTESFGMPCRFCILLLGTISSLLRGKLWLETQGRERVYQILKSQRVTSSISTEGKQIQ